MILMDNRKRIISAIITIMLLLFVYSCAAAGTPPSTGDASATLDTVLTDIQTQSQEWRKNIIPYARRLFYSLALISLVFELFYLILGGGNTLEKFVWELAKFCAITGIFLYLLEKGTQFAQEIVGGMEMLAGKASGNPTQMTPSTIVGCGMDVFFTAVENMSLWSPGETTACLIIAAAVAVMTAVIAGNVLVALASSWVVIFAGMFFLGFGGMRWTRDMAITYFKTVLSIGTTVFVMLLLMQTGTYYLMTYVQYFKTQGFALEWICVILTYSVVLMVLISKTPGMVAGIINGSSIGAAANAGVMSSGMVMGAAGAGLGMATMAGSAISGMMGTAVQAGGGMLGVGRAFQAAHQMVGSPAGQMQRAETGSSYFGSMAKTLASGSWQSGGQVGQTRGDRIANAIDKANKALNKPEGENKIAAAGGGSGTGAANSKGDNNTKDNKSGDKSGSGQGSGQPDNKSGGNNSSGDTGNSGNSDKGNGERR